MRNRDIGSKNKKYRILQASLNKKLSLNFLFWNVGKLSSFESEILSICNKQRVDIVIIAEGDNIEAASFINAGFTEVALKLKNRRKKWVRVFYKDGFGVSVTHKSEHTELIDSDENVIIVDDENSPALQNPAYVDVNRIQLFEVNTQAGSTLFAAIHFPSKLKNDEHTHTELVPTYKNKVHSLAQHSNRLFIVGDFNMNPFDLGMVQPTGFNAWNNRSTILADTVPHQSGAQRIYYNPCWTLLGDYVSSKTYQESSRMGGTHYFNKAISKKYLWYMIDQIIMSRTLIEDFNSGSLRVIENSSYITELYKPKIDETKKLDHLPIFFSFNL